MIQKILEKLINNDLVMILTVILMVTAPGVLGSIAWVCSVIFMYIYLSS